MESLVLTLSSEFFREHFGGTDRIDLYSLLVDTSEALNNLSCLAYADGFLKQAFDLLRVSFELNCLCSVISSTFLKVNYEPFPSGEDTEDCSGLSHGR